MRLIGHSRWHRTTLSDTGHMVQSTISIRALCSIACRVVLGLTLVGAAVPSSAASERLGPVAIGKALPEAAMTGLNGPARKLSSYFGKPLIINVWASWCGPCRAEAASLERFAWSDAGRHYVVIGISTDDDRAAAEQWLRRSNATLTHFIDADQVLENMLGATSIPLTVLVDARGRVVARVRGAREWDSAESVRLIEQAFREPKVKASR